MDHRERFIAPHSMVFSLDGSKLYCGFENAIEDFDVSAPGAEGVRVQTSPTRSSRSGQKGEVYNNTLVNSFSHINNLGIISSLAFSPDGSGILAAGSFNGTIGLYDTTDPKCTLIKLLKSQSEAGITKVCFYLQLTERALTLLDCQVLFHPQSHLLYTSSRHSDSIEVWDMESLSSYPKMTLKRKGATNQRLGMDIDSGGNWLIVGDEVSQVPLQGLSVLAEMSLGWNDLRVCSR